MHVPRTVSYSADGFPSRNLRVVAPIFSTALWVLAAIGAADAANPPLPATLTGRVLNEDGADLPGVKIEVRTSDLTAQGKHWPRIMVVVGTATTGNDGRYSISMPVGTDGMSAEVRATKPGFRSTYTMGRLANERGVMLKPGATEGCSFIVRPATYVAGQVVDETGAPLQNVTVSSDIKGEIHPMWDEEETDRQGRFELFEFRPADSAEKSGVTATLTFSQAGRLVKKIDNVYRLDPAMLPSLRIVLPKGHTVSGRVVDGSNQPVAKIMVEAVFDAEPKRQAVLSDAEGRFQISGLPHENVVLRAHDLAHRTKSKLELSPTTDQNDLVLNLEPVKFPEPRATYTLLGLRVANISPELKEYYDLSVDKGAVVLSRASSGVPFKPELDEGSCIVHGGHIPAGTLQDIVKGMVQEIARSEPDAQGQFDFQLFYTYRSIEEYDRDGDRVSVNSSAVAELKNLLAELMRQP